MKIPTKTLISLLIASATFSRQPTLGSDFLITKRNARLERLLNHHDKKGELRAAVLNMQPADLKALQKKLTLKEIATQRGFADVKTFRRALHGKIRDELRQRGWSARRIDGYIEEKTTATKE